MKHKELTEGLAELAGVAERDHEVQMARADLYKIAKYAIKLHEMLKGVSETEGMQGWQQSKITKAADYMGSVYHAMDYENKFEGVNEAKEKMCPEACCGKPVSECSCGPDCPHCDCYTENKTAKGKKLMAGAGTTSPEVNAAASAQQSNWKASPSFTSEGKSPHKKGSKKYKKHMAAKHASMGESIVTEGAIEGSELIMAAKSMVDKYDAMIQDVGEMLNEELQPVADKIRDEMGSDIADQFVAQMTQALQSTMDVMKADRMTADGATRILTGDAPAEPMGMDADMDDVADMEPTMDMDDEFDAAPAAQGGEEAPVGREKRA